MIVEKFFVRMFSLLNSCHCLLQADLSGVEEITKCNAQIVYSPPYTRWDKRMINTVSKEALSKANV